MDSMPSVLPVSQAEAAREASRRQAIFSGGHKFIWLTLLNTRYRSICGIEMVSATPYVDEKAGGVVRFHLETLGGNTDFQYDPSRGVFRYAMLDCDHNRKFLASHHHLGFWQIEDDTIQAAIARMSADIERELKREKTEVSKENKEEKKELELAPPRKATRGRPARVKKDQLTVPVAVSELSGIQSDMVSINQTRVVAP